MNPILAKVLIMEALKRLGLFFFSKKRIIGWIGAAAIAVGATLAGLQSKEVKEAVCGASVIELPTDKEPAK